MASGLRTIRIKFDGSTEGLTRAMAVAEVEMKAFERAEKKLGDGLDEGDKKGSKFTGSLGKLGSSLGNLAGSVTRSFTRLAALGGALQVGGGAAIAAAGAITTASGALLLLPAAAGAGAAAMLTTKLGAAGITKAFEPTVKVLDRLKAAVSATFTRGLAPAARNVNALLPKLTSGFRSIASAMSGVAVQVTAMLRSSSSTAQLNTILFGASRMVSNLGAALAPIGKAFLTIAATAMPVLQKLTAGAGGLAEKFNAFVQAAAGDGRLRLWIEKGIAEIRKLGDVFGSIARIAKGIFDGLGGGASGLLFAFKPVLAVVERFVTSLPGQQLLGSISTLLGTLADAATRLLDAFSPLIQPILDVAVALAEQLGPIFDQLKPVFAEIGKTLGPALVQLFRDLGPIITPVVRAFAPLVEQLVKGLSPILGALPGLIEPVAMALILLTPVLLGLSIPFMLSTDACIAFVQVLTGDFQGALTTMKGGIEYASTTASAIVNTNWAQMSADVVNGGAQMQGAADSSFMGMMGSVQSGSSGATSALSGQAGQWGGIAGWGAGNATGALQGGADDWITAANRGAGGILGQLSDASGQTGGIGEAIADGLTEGLKRAAGRAVAAAERMAADILARLITVLWIFSPSRVMRDKVGKNISLGVAVGIEDAAPHAMAAAGRMADGVMAATTVGRSIGTANRSYLAAGPLSSASAALGANDGTQSSTPEVHVYIGDTELKDMVRVELRDDRRGTRRAVTAGVGGAR